MMLKRLKTPALVILENHYQLNYLLIKTPEEFYSDVAY